MKKTIKKILSLIIGTAFLFSSISANAYNFPNLGAPHFYYGNIIGELKKEGNSIKTIYILKEKNGGLKQIFSSTLAKNIKNYFIHENNVKILGQDYKNPNNKKYAGIFVKKIWNLDLPKAKKKSFKTKKEIFKESKKTKQLKKFIKEYSQFENVIKSVFLLDKIVIDEVKMQGKLKIKNIFEKNKNGKTLSESEKFLFNELNKIKGFEDFLDLRIKAENENFDDQQIIKLFFSNSDKRLKNVFTSESDLKKFLETNNTEKIKKTAFSKDFQSKNFGEFKINFPQNFDYQKISIGNNTYLRIYYKNFYSNILKFDFNQVENFNKYEEKNIIEKSKIKLSGNYGEKIILNNKIIYQITDKKGNKFEISYSTLDKNFKEIFEKIINNIE